MKSFKQIFLESFCEHEFGSAKRMIGFLSMICALGCIIYVTVAEGCTDNVQGLLQTLVISSCTLLGVSSVTSIWKSNNINKKHENE